MPSSPAKQNEGFHRAFSFDVHAAVPLHSKAFADVPMCCSRDLDTVWHAVRLHATGDVYRVAPDVVDELVGAYDPSDDVARMNADTHIQRHRQVAARPLDRLDHRQGHV